MKRFLLAVAAVLLAPSAYAADMAVRGSPPYVAQSMANWSGLYFGAQLGGEFSAKPITGTLDGRLSELGDPGAFGPNAVGFMGGAHVGLQYQTGKLVFGVEGGGELSSLNSSGQTFAAGMQANALVSKPWDAYAIGKLGVAAGPRGEFLFYGLAGGAFAQLKNDTSVTNGIDVIHQSHDNVHAGWTAGAGIDWKVLEHLAVGVRYRYSNYGTHGVIFDAGEAGSFRTDQHAADNQFTVRGSLFLN